MASEIYNWINVMLTNAGVYAPFLACLLITVESIIPVLPLFVFITINFLAFGTKLGFLISWIFTVVGCMISFLLVRKFTHKILDKILEKYLTINKISNLLESLSLTKVVVLLAIPFAPAFAINIAAGLTKIDTKKYLVALCIGKISLVYFWGFIGTSLIASLKNPYILIKILILVIIAYIVSIVVNKVFKIN